MSVTSYKNLFGVTVLILIFLVQCTMITSQNLFGVVGPRSNVPEPIEYIREEAVMQNEGVGSKIYGVYDNGHSKLANALHVSNMRAHLLSY